MVLSREGNIKQRKSQSIVAKSILNRKKHLRHLLRVLLIVAGREKKELISTLLEQFTQENGKED